MDLIVIGAGVAGSVLTSMARLQGLETLLIDADPQQAGSRWALAALRKSWDAATQEALDWYSLNGGLSNPDTLVTDYMGRKKLQRDWYFVDPRDVLTKPDVEAWVTSVARGVAFTDGGRYEARRVVVAHNDGDTVESWGCTAYSADATVLEAEARHHWLRPFHGITVVRSTDGLVRLGSSVAPSRAAAEARTRRMVQEATELGLVSTGTWTYGAGRRYGRSSPESYGGVSYLGGSARLGFTLAPARARAFLHDIGVAAKIER